METHNLYQQRPAGGDHRFYSPNRDVAWIFDSITNCAINVLRPEYWEPDFAEWMKESGVAEQDLKDAALKFVHGLQTFEHPDTPRAHDGLASAGFFDCPPAARYAMLARLGLVFTQFYYRAVREAVADDAPPDASGLNALERTVRDMEFMRVQPAPRPRRGRWLTGIRRLLNS